MGTKALHRKLDWELQSITCHMGLHRWHLPPNTGERAPL